MPTPWPCWMPPGQSARARGLGGRSSLAILAAPQPDRVAAGRRVTPVRWRRRRRIPEDRRGGGGHSLVATWTQGLMGAWAPEWADDPGRDDKLALHADRGHPAAARRLLGMSLSSDIGRFCRWCRPRPSRCARERPFFSGDRPGVCRADPRRDVSGSCPARPRSSSTPWTSTPWPTCRGTRDRHPAGAAASGSSPRCCSPTRPSTEREQLVGDRAWVDLLDRHQGSAAQDRGTRRGLMKSLGDGVLALFSGPAQGSAAGRG